MHAAFCEAVGGEAKKAAFGPPTLPQDFAVLRPTLEKIAENQGVRMYCIGERQMFNRTIQMWFIYKFPEVLDEYEQASAKDGGWQEKFGSLLSYGTVFGEGADKVVPRMKSPSKIDPDTSVVFKAVWGDIQEL
jgi:hypothetical protein